MADSRQNVLTSQPGQDGRDYDRVPYPVLTHSYSHPDRLAVIGTLMGMHPTPVERCRVLELGAASGGNLIPMAQGLPESHFVGIDLSAGQVAVGQATIRALGLPNVALRCLDLMDVTPDLGQFDYIIAHGLFSWVPEPAREKILSICRENLAPDGIAYVSYNTRPGWNMISGLRDMMLYRTRYLDTPEARVQAARDLLDFLVKAVPAGTRSKADNGMEVNAYGTWLKSWQEILRDEPDAYLLHDLLEETNHPVYFHEFARMAARYGLQYMADADVSSMLPDNLPAKVVETLGAWAGSLIEMEQYLDFVRNQTFRRSLICHVGVSLGRTVRPEMMADLCAAAHIQPEDPSPDVDGVTVVKFQSGTGATFATNHPTTKAALIHLAEIWPRALSFHPLAAAARSRLDPTKAPAQCVAGGDGDDRVLASNLLKGYTLPERLIHLHGMTPAMINEVSERPVASPWARLQVSQGWSPPRTDDEGRTYCSVTNLWHRSIPLSVLECRLLPLLDGSHDRADLLRILGASITTGEVEVEHAGTVVSDPAALADILARDLDRSLDGLAQSAFWVG